MTQTTKELREAVRDKARDPHKLRMDRWTTTLGLTDETAACVAGWAVHLAEGWEIRDSLWTAQRRTGGEVTFYSIPCAGALLLGIEDVPCPDQYLEHLPYDCTSLADVLFDQDTPRDVVLSILDELVAGEYDETNTDKESR